MAWLQVAAAIDEQLYGPLPDDDIAATRGIHLLPRPDTPVFQSWLDVDGLRAVLQQELSMQKWRCRAYGDQVAEEWPIGRTPPEIRQRYYDEMAILDSPTSPESDYVENREVPVETSLIAEKNPQPCDAQCLVSSQTLKVPYTPPSSSEGHCSPSEGQASQRRLLQPLKSAPNRAHAHNPSRTEVPESLEAAASRAFKTWLCNGRSRLARRLTGQADSVPSVTSPPDQDGKVISATKRPKKRQYSEVDAGVDQMAFVASSTRSSPRKVQEDNEQEFGSRLQSHKRKRTVSKSNKLKPGGMTAWSTQQEGSQTPISARDNG